MPELGMIDAGDDDLNVSAFYYDYTDYQAFAQSVRSRR
jgi:hypothetical protein